MAHILSFDFDGTLIDHGADPQFHPALRDQILLEKKRGAIFVINTGRSLSDTLHGIASHGVMLIPDYIIARERDIYINKIGVWKDFGPWNKIAKKAHAAFLAQHQRFFAHLQEQIRRHTKATFLSDDEGDTGVVATTDDEMADIVTFLQEHLTRFPSLGWQRNGIYLRFMHADHSKGTALTELARLLKIPRENIFAGGDNYNDLSMLHSQVAARIACPDNAIPAVKDQVRVHGGFVGTKNASQGMLQALHHFFPHGQSTPPHKSQHT